MSTRTNISLPDELLAKITAIAAREKRTPEAQVEFYLEQIAESPDSFKQTLAGRDDEVTVAELVPLMPKGLRSRASIFRLLRDRAISGRKVRGTWNFKPSKVLTELDHFERVSSVSAFTDQWMRTTKRKSRSKR